MTPSVSPAGGPASSEPLTAVSLFAGIGGFDLACQQAGIEVAAAAETDPACRGILARHFPQTRLFEDVAEVTSDQLRSAGFVPRRGVVCAGWPCQGNAAAGRRKGLADPRSGLWRHVVRLLAAARPRWFLGENVPGLLAVNNGRDFWAVVSDLDDLGYGVAWRVLDAQWFGLAQRRKRLFLAGCLGDGAPWLPAQVLLEPESGGRHPAPGRPPQPEVAGTLGSRAGGARTTGLDGHRAYVVSTLQGGGRRGHRVDAEGAAGGHLVTVPVAARGRDGGDRTAAGQAGDPAFTIRPPGCASSGPEVTCRPASAGRQRPRRAWPARPGAGENTGTPQAGARTAFPPEATATAVRRLTPREWERLQGFPDDWTRRDADGRQQSDSVRYGRLGNAVAVPVAAWITRRLAAADQQTRPGRPGGAAA